MMIDDKTHDIVCFATTTDAATNWKAGGNNVSMMSAISLTSVAISTAAVSILICLAVFIIARRNRLFSTR